MDAVNRQIKALSLWQPWASLIAIGAKEFETRSWQHPYRGLLAIHAAKQWTQDEIYMTERFARTYPVATQGKLLKPLPLMAVLCVAKLVDIVPTERIRDSLAAPEHAFGDYSNRRFAWQLELVEVFDKPIPCKGAQGLWNWTWEGGA